MRGRRNRGANLTRFSLCPPLGPAFAVDGLGELQVLGVELLYFAGRAAVYLSWLHAEGHIGDRLRIKLLPDPPKPLRALSDAEIRRLVMFRPRGRIAQRTWTIIVTLLDTGLRR